MAKVICEECGTSFLYDVVKDMKVCPVCGKALWDDSEKENRNVDNSSQNTGLSFGEGIELGENDSFDEDKIDFWWYEIREPGTLDESDTGNVYVTCTTCGRHTVYGYSKNRNGEYVLLNSKVSRGCKGCGKELKNHILSKRPIDWVDPRKRTMITDWENIPKCPICSSVKIHKISITNKAASAMAFGMLAAGHVSKTFKCDTCGAKF
jgi:rubrerythrin